MPRLVFVDALRAAALFGILQVNIQSFAWGPGDALGYFLYTPGPADVAAYALVAALVATKFIALFAFLFGLGFALQQRGLSRRLGAGGAQAAARRRYRFLLVLGIAHGTLLYYGDILTAYALCGFVLLRYARVRPARLARAARNWMIGYAVLVAAIALLTHAPATGDGAVSAAALQRLATYTTASWAEQLPARVADYTGLLFSTLVGAGPMLIALFLLGALAGRLGWLAHPQRHPRVWRCAAWLGAAGGLVALAAAGINTTTALHRPAEPTALGTALLFVSFPLAALYVAALVRWRDAAPVRATLAWLAPAGRMPLTNYLLQSVAMGALLSGWGLGLGAALGHATLALLALAITATQVVLSRWWIGSGRSGPLEALWRRVTYGRA